MLSIQACGPNAADYFFSEEAQAQNLKSGPADYYLAGGKTNFWLGDGAHRLKLHGAVNKATFRNLLNGRGPNGASLVQNPGAPDRQTGWDLTFSAPKSVSVLWAIGSDELKEKLEAAHLKAVKETIKYIEETAAYSRRGKGGHRREPAGLVIAGFEHHTSRPVGNEYPDPQLHTHCVVTNVGVRSDGTTGTIVSLELYRAKMASGAFYQATLAVELDRLGLECESILDKGKVPSGFFELAGVPAKVLEAFSQRRKEILSLLGVKGFSSAKASELANLSTRASKGFIPPALELFTVWAKKSASLGFTREHIKPLFSQRHHKPSAEVIAGALKQAHDVLTASVSFFNERMLFRETLIRTIGQGVQPREVQAAVRKALATSSEFVPLGYHRDEQQFTTRELWNTEQKLLDSAKALSERKVESLHEHVVQKAIMRARQPAGKGQPKKPLSTEQREAVEYLTSEGGSIRTLSGYAGTGKTQALKAVRDAYERCGFRVVGASTAAIAARGLERGSGIKSATVAKRLLQLERHISKVILHHARQLLRDVMYRPTFQLDKLNINSKTVLVVDEAGMVGTKELAALVKATERGGGRIILVGDHRQLPPIGPGGGFRHLADQHGSYELTEVGRQRQEWAKQKGKDIAHGKAEEALRTLAEQKKLTVATDRIEAVKLLVTSWAKTGIKDPTENVIIGSTNLEVLALNTAAQAARREAGHLGMRSAPLNSSGQERVRVGDRVLFKRNDPKLKVFNGSRGTVKAIYLGGFKISVLLDGEKKSKMIDLRKYDDLSLGYAFTAHRSQGATFDNTFVLFGGAMLSRELGYVIATRERESAHFFTDRMEAGDKVARLAQGLKVDGPLDGPLVQSLKRSVLQPLAHELRRDATREAAEEHRKEAEVKPVPEPEYEME